MGLGGQVLNGQGYPTTVGANATIYIPIQGYPNGNYQFYCTGKLSNLSFTGGGTVNGVTYRTTGNGILPGTLQTSTVNGTTITTATIPLKLPPVIYPVTYALAEAGQGYSLDLSYTPTDSNDLPCNFHLMRPDVPAWYSGWEAHNKIFGKEFLQALAPYCAIRFVGWMWPNSPAPTPGPTIGGTVVTGPYNGPNVTQSYGVTTWASRAQPTYFHATGRGICYENMIELCNETNKDLWINVPLYAAGPSATDWCANMATLVKKNLHPNLHCYYEIWDELWNWGAGAYWYSWTQVDAWASAEPTLAFLGATGSWKQHGGEMGLLLMNAAKIMQPILGAQGRPVLAGWIGSTVYSSAGLQYIEKYFGAPSNYIYGIAVAPYFSFYANDPPGTSLDQQMLDYISQNLQVWMVPQTALAKQYNIKLCCYEAGQSLASATQAQFDQNEPLQSDPGMAAAYYSLASVLKNANTDLCMWTNFCQPDNQFGFWGTINDVRQIYNNPPSVKYQAQVNIAAGCKCGIPATPAANPLTAAQKRALARAKAEAAKIAAERAAAAAKAKAKARAAAAKAAAEKAKEEAAAKKKH